MQSIRQLVASEFDTVNRLIIDELHSDVGLVESIGHYIVEAGGKRIRPLLVLLTARALGGINGRHCEFAAVIEFIHTATLLHDDVVDVSALRRGRPTANAKWGNAPSVLVGDFIYSRAFQLMVRMELIDIMKLMADTTNMVAEGEVLQLQNAGNPDTNEQGYFDVIERKTAALFKAATEGAAIIAGADAAVIDACSRYGYHLGMAFQLIDDVLDYSGDSGVLGKNIGDDLAEGKPTLPLIRIMTAASRQDAATVRDAIATKNASGITSIVQILHQCGALDYTRATARRHRDLAASALEEIPGHPQVGALRELLELAILRDN